MNIYIWKELPAGIYWSRTDWLISVVGSNDIITIADKNLWATTVYNNGDTLTQANMWNMYQWGNNYWFPSTWSVSTSSTQVNASSYWPWNYYSNSNFITNGPRENGSYNYNLRWGTTWTNAAMQWPCASGYHIPTKDEVDSLKSLWITIGAWTNNIAWVTSFWTYLKIPKAWYRDFNSYWNVVNQWSDIRLWTSIRSNDFGSYQIEATTSRFLTTALLTSYWCSIRPFKNEPVTPTSTRTVLYQAS